MSFTASGVRNSCMHRLPACGASDSNTKPGERVQQLKIQRSLGRGARIGADREAPGKGVSGRLTVVERIGSPVLPWTNDRLSEMRGDLFSCLLRTMRKHCFSPDRSQPVMCWYPAAA
jgi:hypothetical protein